jgi:hypothetical protein
MVNDLEELFRVLLSAQRKESRPASASKNEGFHNQLAFE